MRFSPYEFCTNRGTVKAVKSADKKLEDAKKVDLAALPSLGTVCSMVAFT